MKNKILDCIIDNIKKNYNYSDVKLKEIRYGLETLYLSIFKLLIIILLSFFIHTSYYLGLLFIFYGILRLTAFGLHTKSSIQCWIFSISIFTIFPFLIKTLVIDNLFLYIGSLLLLILICIYAPADTEKRPIINMKKRRLYKIISIITTIIYIIVMIITKNLIIKKALFFSILLEVILILPVSYRLLGLKYNNYLLYKGKEDKK